MKKYKMFINGNWEDGSSGDYSTIVNPTTEEEFAAVPIGNQQDALKAIHAAKHAQVGWALLPPLERAKYLKEAANMILKHKDELSKLIVAEQGKIISEALGEVDGAIFLLQYSAEWALRIEGDVLPSSANESILIKKVPHGVVLGVTPWNYPFAVPARKIGPALITGNTVILKPHENTSLSALELARMFEMVGLPKGVLNVVTGTGRGVGNDLVAHPDVHMITMTGSVRAGKEIYAASSPHLKKISLELGGKAPFIVMQDADLESAVKHAMISRFTNCGQICICNERMYVHETIFDSFVEKFIAAAKKLEVGDPMKPESNMGPKANRNELEKVVQLVDEARTQGANVLTGGAPLREGKYARGYWYPPTVITNVQSNMRIMREEVFGPVIPIVKFSSIDEAIEQANDSQYGLSAYIFGNNYREIMRAVEKVDFGEIFVNRTGAESFHAFHSGYRMSGVGGDDGKYGIDSYLKKKTVYLNFE